MMSKTGIYQALVLSLAASLTCLIGGCTEDNPCDEDQVLVDGWCNPAPADASIPTPTPDASLGEAGPSTGATAFGRTCATSAECEAPADFCSIPPGNCTATGCEVDPSICPPSWTCMDLTPFGAAMHICVPPM